MSVRKKALRLGPRCVCCIVSDVAGYRSEWGSTALVHARRSTEEENKNQLTASCGRLSAEWGRFAVVASQQQSPFTQLLCTLVRSPERLRLEIRIMSACDVVATMTNRALDAFSDRL